MNAGARMQQSIVMAETSADFREGFMFAVRAIADMGLNECYVTKAQFLKQINDIITLHDFGAFFPAKKDDK